MKIQIKNTFEISIGDKTLFLSKEEASELYTALKIFFSKEEIKKTVPQNYPSFWPHITTTKKFEQRCMHESCANCHGTGTDAFGKPCIHSISCPCPRCTPTCFVI